MNQIVLFQCDKRFSSFIKRELKGQKITDIRGEDVEKLRAHLEDRDHPVGIVLVGSRAHEPIRVAQKIHFSDKNISILLLANSEGLAGLTKAIQTSPLFGSEVSSALESPTEHIKVRVKSAISRARKRKKYEQAIFQANTDIAGQSPFLIHAIRYLDSLLDVAPIGIGLVNAAGKILALNSYAQKLLDCQEREAIELPISSFFEAKDNHIFADYFDLVLSSPQAQAKVFLQQKGNEALQYIEITFARMTSRASAPDLILLMQNVTDRVMAARKEKERTQLIALNKAKDEFISLASHQLRTPATAVKQYVSMLIAEYAGPLNGEQLQYLQIAYDSNERELTIVDELLKTAQLDAGGYTLHKSLHNIPDLIQRIIDIMKTSLELKNQTILLTCTDQSITAFIDKAEIEIAITNLIENASKYSYAGGEIKITISRNDLYIFISVSDNGVGIKKSNLYRIFDKFTRINNDLSDTVLGTGLGLYWVKQIVELHNGRIAVQSKSMKGTTFTVTLPA